MAKYHINKAGEPGVCQATYKCPFGSAEEHHDSPEAARDAYEKEMTAELVPEGASKKTLTRNDMDRIVSEARARGERPNLSDANLSGADLSGADLREADLGWANLRAADLSEAYLYEANLSGADLSAANLSEADLRWANLREADLRAANLSEADLYEADLSRANLREADLGLADLYGANLYMTNLSDANLSDANLCGADLYEADLSNANLSNANLRAANLRAADLSEADPLLRFDGLPSGQATLTPTPQGWMLTVGCWTGTVQGLRDLIAGTEWPEARGDEQDRRRPGLALLADLCDDHIARRPTVIDNLAKRWV